MQMVDPSFKMVKPVGREGDWKADGYSSHSQDSLPVLRT